MMKIFSEIKHNILRVVERNLEVYFKEELKKESSLFKNNLLVSIKRKGKLYPFLGINTPDANNIFINYFISENHLTIHANRVPYVKHLRNNQDKKIIYETEVENFGNSKFYEPLGGNGFSIEWLDDKYIMPLSKAALMFINFKVNHHQIIVWEVFKRAGYASGGLCVSGVLLPVSEEPEQSKIKETLNKYIPPREKETRFKCKFYDKCLLLKVYDEKIPPFGFSLGVSHKVNMLAKGEGEKELIIKVFPKRGEKSIVKNTGWERIDERESPV